MRREAMVLMGMLALASCDRAKDLAETTRRTVSEQIKAVKADVFEEPPEVTDPGLAGLVDENGDGYLFRKDLPFPARVKVSVKDEKKVKWRRFQSSMLGKETLVIDGSFKAEYEIERDSEEATLRVVRYVFVKPMAEGAESESEGEVVLPTGTVEMELGGGKWLKKKDKADSMIGAALIGVNFRSVLLNHGLLPRGFWFGSRRLKIGDEVEVGGAQLAMLVPAKTSGKVAMKLTAIEPLEGHPCGVFSVTGSIDAAEMEHLDGSIGSEQWTIDSGKVWLSLIYPVILKEELDIVLTSRTGKGSGNYKQVQGRTTSTVERKWVAAPAGGN